MATQVDWYYHRKGWTTCKKASGFLEAHGIAVRETINASTKLGYAEALAMARKARRVIAAKGKKVTAVDLAKEQPSDAVLAGLMLGPTGNLRAPTMRVGQTLLIGYNEDIFADELGWTRTTAWQLHEAIMQKGDSMMKEVTVYSNIGWGPCHQAMEYLSQRGVPYTEKNVARDPEAVQELMSMGLRSLPVIVIGDTRLSGFNPAAIDEALTS
jgi:arsenate reductase-like glutaredoxin family protein